VDKVMSAFDRALKRARQETGTVPEAMAAAAAWLQSADGEDSTIPPDLLDRFTSEGGVTPPRDIAPTRTVSPPPVVEPTPVVQPTPVVEPESRPRDDVREAPPVRPSGASNAASDAFVGARAAEPPSMKLFNGFNPRVVGKIVSGAEMDRATAEQYGRLAAVLHHAQVERQIKTVMVTSAMAGEGKTLTALNLALTLSESYGRRVAFIDADLRCSRVHELLNVVRVTGLSEALQDGGQLQSRMLPISPRLSVLLAGCSNLDPKGALTSRGMSHVLTDAAAIFDWVIVDTPPVMLLPDTHLLARMVDVAIVVVRAGKTSYDVVDRAVQALDRKRVLGVVLNDAQDAEALQYYYSARATL
jgi:capsular exopolysaccharide synthesis family protein